MQEPREETQDRAGIGAPMKRLKFKEWRDELERITKVNSGVELEEIISLRDPRLRQYWRDGTEPADAYCDFVERPEDGEDEDLDEIVKYDLSI
jgi:hypothetical protein